MPLNAQNINLSSFRLAIELELEFKDVLIENEVYFRGNLHSLSLISHSEAMPEIGVTYRNYCSRSLTTLKSCINEIKKQPLPKRPTPEKSLQAWIIQQAQRNNNFLPFDKSIKFITSELTMKNNGAIHFCDIIGYNTRTHQAVLFELKPSRLFDQLKEQIDIFSDIFSENYIFFQQLMQLYGFPELEKIPMKAIVWPTARTSPIKKWVEAGIAEYTYQKNSDGFHFKSYLDYV